MQFNVPRCPRTLHFTLTQKYSVARTSQSCSSRGEQSYAIATTFAHCPVSASTLDAPMQREKKKERLEFDKFPNPSTVTLWKMNFRREGCSGSCHPSYGSNLPNFQALDAKTANFLLGLLAANDSRAKAFIEEQKTQNETDFSEED